MVYLDGSYVKSPQMATPIGTPMGTPLQRPSVIKPKRTMSQYNMLQVPSIGSSSPAPMMISDKVKQRLKTLLISDPNGTMITKSQLLQFNNILHAICTNIVQNNDPILEQYFKR